MGDREYRDLLRSLNRDSNREQRSQQRRQKLVCGNEENCNDMQQQQEQCSWEAANSNVSSLEYHPVYKEISRRNGYLNRLDLNELKRECKANQLDSNGRKDAVRRRLKEHFKLQKLVEAGLVSATTNRNLDFFVVIDFEATCEQLNPLNYQHEIIEFPAILVDSATPARVIDVFHSYCRPVINTQLSEFCKALTRIQQSTVDKAPLFEQVYDNFVAWLDHHGLGKQHSFAILTDGPFDMAKFLSMQLKYVGREMPEFAKQWVNLRKAFHNFYRGNFNQSTTVPRLPGLSEMLSCLELEFEGQPHSGMDDAHNIARVLMRMLKDEAFVRINEKIDENRSSGRTNGGHRVPILNVNREEAEKWMRSQKKAAKKH